MPEQRDLVVLAGGLGKLRLGGREWEVREPSLREAGPFLDCLERVVVPLMGTCELARGFGGSWGLLFALGALPVRSVAALARGLSLCIARRGRNGRWSIHPDPELVLAEVSFGEMVEVARAVLEGGAIGRLAWRAAAEARGEKPPKVQEGPRWDWVNTLELLAAEHGWEDEAMLDMSMTKLERYLDAWLQRQRARSRAEEERTPATATPIWSDLGTTVRKIESGKVDESIVAAHRRGVERLLLIEAEHEAAKVSA